MTNRERARQIIHQCGIPTDPMPTELLAFVEQALDEARRQGEERMRERAARAVNDLDALSETTDANLGEARGLCRAEAAIRALEHQCEEIGADDFGLDYHACGGEFLCPGCDRVVGWCCGAHDDLEELCDDCAAKVRQTREQYGAAIGLSPNPDAGKCPTCDGKGFMRKMSGNPRCPDCGGTGRATNCDGGDRG